MSFPFYLTLKRLVDICVSAALLLALSPLFLLIVICLFLDDGRPIFFKQTRIGQHGKPFEIYKFRTLSQKAHDVTNPQAVVTFTGKFLRRWGLDELPQLINILKNDMSLVGPRPTIPEQVEKYSDFEKRRLQMRPGITGWAQIHGRNGIGWPERIQLDVEYISEASLLLDLEIMLRTPGSLAATNDTYGTSGKNSDFEGATDSAYSAS